MKKYYLFIVLFITIFKVNCQNIDTTYLHYHDLINKAEKFYFMQNNTDSAFACYDRAFKEYDYVFLKDLLNATQISIFENKKHYKKYLLRGFKYGLKVNHFNNFPLFTPIVNNLLNDEDFMKKSASNRKKYIKNINYKYLLKIYDLGIKDQIEKSKSDKLYSETKKNNLKDIRYYTSIFGFPSAKIIGIDDKNIFEEIGFPEFDIDNRKQKFSYKLNHRYSAENNSFSNTIITILLIHNECAFIKLKEQLYSAMLKGEIHPREIGLLYDNMYRHVNSKHYKCNVPNIQNGVFLLNLFCDYSKYNIDTNQVNKLRLKWKIVEIEVDQKKKELEKKYGFRLFYGFWNCM